MTEGLLYFLQLVISGLAVGSLYALVALGFVLIYKATDILNFAHGEAMMVGALVCYALIVSGIPFLWAVLITAAIAMIMGLLTERLVLRPMLGEPQFAVVMVTIGLSIFLRSLSGIIFGHDNKVFPAPFAQGALNLEGLVLSHTHLWAMVVSGFMVILFFLFFKYSRLGLIHAWGGQRSRHGHVDGHQRQESVCTDLGDLLRYRGCRGDLLSQRDGAEHRSHPGSHQSIPRGHSGRAGKYSRRYHRRFGDRRAGDIGRWLSRPDIAGCKRSHIIRCPLPGSYDQALRPLRQRGTGAGVDQYQVGREARRFIRKESMRSKTFRESYQEDIRIFQTIWVKFWLILFIVGLLSVPLWADPYIVYMANISGIAIIAAMGLNILTGLTGQISLGHAAFVALGAYTSAILATRLGMPFWITIPEWRRGRGILRHSSWVSLPSPERPVPGHGHDVVRSCGRIRCDPLGVADHGGARNLGPAPNDLWFHSCEILLKLFYVTIFFVAVLTMCAKNIARTRVGRAFVAIRDRDVAAGVIGVNLTKYKVMAFAIARFMEE